MLILSSLVVFVPRALARHPRQSVCFQVLRSWSVDDLEVEFSQLFCPSGLSSSQFFRCHEVFQVLVISEYLNWNIRAFQFGSPMLKAADDSKQFFVIDLIVAFCRIQVFAIECNWVQDPIIVVLREHAPVHVVRGICLENCLTVSVEMAQSWRRGHTVF